MERFPLRRCYARILWIWPGLERNPSVVGAKWFRQNFAIYFQRIKSLQWVSTYLGTDRILCTLLWWRSHEYNYDNPIDTTMNTYDYRCHIKTMVLLPDTVYNFYIVDEENKIKEESNTHTDCLDQIDNGEWVRMQSEKNTKKKKIIRGLGCLIVSIQHRLWRYVTANISWNSTRPYLHTNDVEMVVLSLFRVFIINSSYDLRYSTFAKVTTERLCISMELFMHTYLPVWFDSWQPYCRNHPAERKTQKMERKSIRELGNGGTYSEKFNFDSLQSCQFTIAAATTTKRMCVECDRRWVTYQ